MEIGRLRNVPRESCETRQDWFLYLRRRANTLTDIVTGLEACEPQPPSVRPPPAPISPRRQHIRSIMTVKGKAVRVVERRRDQLELGL